MGRRRRGVGVDTRLLGKSGDFSGAQDAWRDWSTVFKGVRWRSDTTSAEADGQCREGDRADAASAQLCWMMLVICKGAALNTVFLAGDSVEAWRQLTEKYEPKKRTRFAGQVIVHLVLVTSRHD